MNEFNEIDSSFYTLNENNFIDLILYGSDKFNDKKNYNILVWTLKFILNKIITPKIHQRFSKISQNPAIILF